jgi:hypothetical protein
MRLLLMIDDETLTEGINRVACTCQSIVLIEGRCVVSSGQPPMRFYGGGEALGWGEVEFVDRAFTVDVAS